MVDKSNKESINSDVQSSSDDMFLRGSGKDETLRKKIEEEDLKLDDSQEELALQNIQQGSEQYEQQYSSVEEEGAGSGRESYLETKSENVDFSTQSDQHIDNLNNEDDEKINHQVQPVVTARIDGDEDFADISSEESDDTFSEIDGENHDIGQSQVASRRGGNDLPVSEADHQDDGIQIETETAENSNEEINAIDEDLINRAPEAGDDIRINVNEGESAINGQLQATDINPGAGLTYQLTDGINQPDGFSLSSDGVWLFNAQHTAYDHLSPGDTVIINLPVVVTDEYGASDTTHIQITVTGTNDAPVAGSVITSSSDEGGESISGQLTAADVDDGASATFTVSDGAVVPDGFVLDADGGYSFDAANNAYDHLNVGDSQVLTVPVTVTDEHGATDTTQIQLDRYRYQ